MSKENREKKSKLTTKYRFAIVDDESHKNLFVIKGSRLSLILTITVTFLIILTGVLLIVSYTPIKQLIPGYPSAETRREAIHNAYKIDSLERVILLWNLQLTNIQRVITGKEPIMLDSAKSESNNPYGKESYGNSFAKDDSLLREEIMKQERFNLTSSANNNIEQIEGLLFFPPAKGIITEGYNKSIGHPYLDIAAPSNSTVSAVLDGTIIFAGWSDDTGYTIQIQHSNNLVSVYKHNNKLLKQIGDKVSAGTPVSLVGDTGKLSTGSHLHFELWHNGEPIDPSKYINF